MSSKVCAVLHWVLYEKILSFIIICSIIIDSKGRERPKRGERKMKIERPEYRPFAQYTVKIKFGVYVPFLVHENDLGSFYGRRMNNESSVITENDYYLNKILSMWGE